MRVSREWLMHVLCGADPGKAKKKRDIDWGYIFKFKWFRRLHIIYIYGFLVNFRPADPFIYDFYTKTRNIDTEEVTQNIFPITVYSTAVHFILLSLTTDLFNYNPFVILSPICGVIAEAILVGTDRLDQAQVAQVVLGSFSATQLAYYWSIYAHTDDPKSFQRLTALVRISPLLGQFISALLGQLLASQEWLDYKELHYINLACCTAATLCAVAIPWPQSKAPEEATSGRIARLTSNFLKSFPDKYAVKWAFWLAFSICGYQQATLYVQVLWRELDSEGNYNGLVEGGVALVAAFFTSMAAFITLDLKYKGDLIMSTTSMFGGFMLILISQIDIRHLNYFFFMLYGGLFHLIETVLVAALAKKVQGGAYGLIFGFIALIAAILQTVIVCFLNAEFGFKLSIYNEFMAYGFYHLAISVVFIGLGLGYWLAKHTYQ